MEQNGRGIAGLFLIPSWKTLGRSFLFFHGLLLIANTASALPSPQGQTQQASANPTACAEISPATASKLAATPSGPYKP